MFEKRKFVTDAIRKYLEMELADKKKINCSLTELNLPDYQLIVNLF